ncbi:hypothetical protein H2200_006965 [Cladophialophora chaetospira]|uniref:F-box domain-containing protein n=1 Tax=Cladophialophora chaetospira TaxID=386627 RepID=A0AA39CI84_9EURO|nr:hypothetical protein H2200_006965 [Cladophialophora chaetospira]
MSMDKLPDEVLVKICALLDFQSNANLRLGGKRYAEVGAEALVKRIRFHCTDESLQRLHTLAQHNVLCKYVDTVVFEGNLLAAVPCIHTYQGHYMLDHHQHERPQPSPKNATAREKRLYDRNMAKFTRDIQKKYDRYLDLFTKQQKILSSSAYNDMIDPSMLRFPRLTKIALSTVGRCKHVLSGRFLESFTADCAMPIEQDTKPTKEQLKHLMFPNSQPLIGLRTLEVHVMSPKFFFGFVPTDMLCLAFASLRNIDLNFRVEKDDRGSLETSADRCYADFSKGILRDALSAANDLEQLTINFDDFGYYGPVTTLDKIVGTKAWPKLVSLNIDYMTTTEEYLMGLLKRHPSLKDLRLGFMTLVQGHWPSTTRRMRKELSLEQFVATGILEDNDQMFPMNLLDGDAYAQDFSHISLGESLGLWVTDEADVPDEDDYHPLKDEEFTDEEELRDQYGPFADEDDFSDMDCDSD